jgi:molecular chaperone GrpE
MTDRKHSKHDEARRAAAAAPGAPDEAAPPAGDVAPEETVTVAEEAAPQAGASIEQMIAERDEYLDHLRRLKAEFDNYRKRVQRDNEELRLRAAEAVVESLLPVMDNMGRALHAAAQHEEGQLLAGVELVAGQLKDTLAGHGLEQLDVEPGNLFDPTLHEAVLTQESDEFDEGQVAQVLESGYLLHGRLLRPAKVIVAR